jgi:hypothetical protein
MVATRRSDFDSSLERTYGMGLKNPLIGEVRVRGFSKLGLDSLLLWRVWVCSTLFGTQTGSSSRNRRFHR